MLKTPKRGHIKVNQGRWPAGIGIGISSGNGIDIGIGIVIGIDIGMDIDIIIDIGISSPVGIGSSGPCSEVCRQSSHWHRFSALCAID